MRRLRAEIGSRWRRSGSRSLSRKIYRRRLHDGCDPGEGRWPARLDATQVKFAAIGSKRLGSTFSYGRRRFGDGNQRGPQQAIMMEVARLNDAGDVARRTARVGHFIARFMTLGIERLAERLDPRHAMFG